jgi:hypothetical protein
MSLSGFQLALCDAIASPQLARRLRDAPTEFLQSYDLTDRERRRLAAIAGQRGLRTSSAIYRLNRVTPLCEYLPMTTTLLGDELVAHAEEYWATHGTDLQFAPEVAGFGGFLTERLRRGTCTSPYVAEILAFELAVNELRFGSDGNRYETPRDGQGGVDPAIRVVPFAHDPAALLESLTDGQVPTDAAPGEHYLLVDGRNGGLRVVPITPPLALRLIQLLAGAQVDLDRDEDRALGSAGLLAIDERAAGG